MTVHATQDTGLPGARNTINWPEHGGRDLSRPANWSGYLGVFTPPSIPYLGVYDSQLDAGAVVLHGPGAVGGKLFSFSSNFDKQLYTDGSSEYVELWSGAQPSFWDNPTIAPGASRAIETAWQPLWGIGDLLTATEDGAIGRVVRRDGGRTVSVQPSRVLGIAPVVIRRNGQEIFRSAPMELRPDQPLAIELPASVGRETLQLEAGTLRVDVP
jgi:hypothetical protein